MVYVPQIDREDIILHIVAPNRTIQNISRELKFSQLYTILKISSCCCTVASKSIVKFNACACYSTNISLNPIVILLNKAHI